jgi:fluoride exporter
VSYLLVFFGGGLGSVCRYAVGRLLGNGGFFPLATFTANTLSCIALGLLLALAARNLLPEPWRLLLITGFCGGFSTFSTFSVECLQLLRQGQYFIAFAYVASSLLAGLFCLSLGLRLSAS